ncbi:MAG: hypothetical protein ABWY10_12835, partial [Tardiphaga sp.]
RAEDAALLSRDEDAAWILRIMAAVTLVDVGALDLSVQRVRIQRRADTSQPACMNREIVFSVASSGNR